MLGNKVRDNEIKLLTESKRKVKKLTCSPVSDQSIAAVRLISSFIIAVAEFLDFWASFRDVMRLILVCVFVVLPVLVVIMVDIRIALFKGAASTSFVSGIIWAVN